MHSQRSLQLLPFILRQRSRSGVMFIRQNLPGDLSIAGADTSLTSIKLPVDRGRQAAILNSARALLQDDRHCVGSPPAYLAADAQIGMALDRISLSDHRLLPPDKRNARYSPQIAGGKHILIRAVEGSRRIHPDLSNPVRACRSG